MEKYIVNKSWQNWDAADWSIEEMMDAVTWPIGPNDFSFVDRESFLGFNSKIKKLHPELAGKFATVLWDSDTITVDGAEIEIGFYPRSGEYVVIAFLNDGQGVIFS
jgi:hypothetical protein